MVAFEKESWIWFSIVMLVAISRLISRRMALGSFKRFQADEYVMSIVLGFYTTLIVLLNIVSHTSSNLLPPGYEIAHMSKEDISERRYGSKIILAVEESQIQVVWGAKLCLIIMYSRLTQMRREGIAIKLLGAYVVVTWIVMEVLYLGVWCRPFHNYWAVPTPNVQCNTATNHLITNAVFNLTSDIAMIAIGLPMFLRLTLPWSKKAPLIGIFSLGVFVIVAAILNKVYSFSEPFGGAWIYWYIRESSTALIVANLPFVWLLYRKILGIRSVNGTRADRYGSDPYSGSGRPNGRRKGPKPSLDPVTGLAVPGDSDADLELTQSRGRSGSLTMEEMLRGDYASNPHEKEATPFTHPALFYGSGAQRDFAMPQAPVERVVLSDSPEQDPVRRDTSLDVNSSTLASSHLISKGSPKSAGSFV